MKTDPKIIEDFFRLVLNEPEMVKRFKMKNGGNEIQYPHKNEVGFTTEAILKNDED